MTELVDLLPKTSMTVQAIFDSYKKAGDAESQRGYLGASIIGHACSRYLWYNFRMCCQESFDGRMYRLFETGDKEERRFVSDLRQIAVQVHDVDENGRQFAVHAVGGHFSGHMDGCALGIPEAPKTWHVLEFKTHNAKSFAKLVKTGVKVAKPMHYAQMMVYMGLTGMTRALYLAKNKDTDDLYSERVRFDKEEYSALMERAENIIRSPTPPQRISTREDYFECSWCPAHKLCWGCPGPALPVPAINCRQCCHATPAMDGMAHWVCENYARSLSDADQMAACEDHLVLPGLISFAEPTDFGNDDSSAGKDWIDFHNSSDPGAAPDWRHGAGPGCFTTKELMVLPADKLTNKFVQQTKDDFGAIAVGSSTDDILLRYPESDCRIAFKGPIGLLRVEWQRLYGGEDIQAIEPIEKCEGFNYRAAEFPGGRAVIVWTEMTQIGSSNCEIRESVE